MNARSEPLYVFNTESLEQGIVVRMDTKEATTLCEALEHLVSELESVGITDSDVPHLAAAIAMETMLRRALNERSG